LEKINRINNRKITVLLVSTLVVGFAIICGGSDRLLAKIGDRILLEINNSFYTQRQMESYLFLKDFVRGEYKGKTNHMNQDNWKPRLESYLYDMLIHQDTQRMGSFFPNDKSISGAMNAIKAEAKKSPEFFGRMKFLGVDGKNLRRVVAQILQVEGYRRSKSLDSKSAPSKRRALNWATDLRKKFVIRHFDGSKKFEELTAIQ